MFGRGKLQCVGAITLEKYREYIEKDSALERCFQQIYVDQPLIGTQFSYFKDCAGRFLPNKGKLGAYKLVAARRIKSIDLVDELAAKLKIEITSKPNNLNEIYHLALKFKMEKLSLPICVYKRIMNHDSAVKTLTRAIQISQDMVEANNCTSCGRKLMFNLQAHNRKLICCLSRYSRTNCFSSAIGGALCDAVRRRYQEKKIGKTKSASYLVNTEQALIHTNRHDWIL
ncbi:uncharacterized protein LOC130015427 [Mercurialis annua]|uniref:uncharacterized protein LOC130015427 n=1 Tax=Mercurialis annua TaxID=3986 RepID=UPI0024AFF341|nr:uncharacterized protein LOC130015427 [Mercurialis annua]